MKFAKIPDEPADKMGMSSSDGSGSDSSDAESEHTDDSEEEREQKLVILQDQVSNQFTRYQFNQSWVLSKLTFKI